MAGHSKWANTKHRKGRVDAKRGKIFTKIGREIVVAVKESGSDPDSNSKLRDAIAKARAANMPNDTISKAIKKASGELSKVDFEEIVYEGYGPGGVAVMVDIMTDNRNRTAADVRHAFDKNGGSMGANGCVNWMFDKKGVMVVEKAEGSDEDEMMMVALDAGAEDFEALDDVYEITTEYTEFSTVREALEGQGITFLSAEIQRVPQNTTKIEGDNVDKFLKMIDMLEDNDDVQSVSHNAEMDEEA